MGIDLAGAGLEGATLDPILEAAWKAINEGRVKIDPADLGKSAVRGALGGVALEGVVLSGKLINEWEDKIRGERIDRGRVRPDN